MLLACSSSSGAPPAAAAGDDGGNGEAIAGPTVTEHGTVLDYGTYLSSGQLVGVSGMTVTDNGLSTTTDAQGVWSLTVPAGTLSPVVTGTSKGDPYSNLLLPVVTATGGDMQWGNQITPDVSTFALEQTILSNDKSKALVHIVVEASGSCASVAGGTITLTSPPGAKVMYFSPKGPPSAMQASFAALDGERPVADIYDIDPGGTLAFQVVHPTCKQAEFPATFHGGSFTGQAPLKPTEPGDYNSAIVVWLE
jgi:hypothetical protein